MPESLREKLDKIDIILSNSPRIDRDLSIGLPEFEDRKRKVWQAINDEAAVDVAFAFSDEHYNGDVPYLGGNTNASIEQVAFGLGPDIMRSGIIAGFEGVYIAGQLAARAGNQVYATSSLQLADEEYPVEGASLKEIFTRIAGRGVERIGLLTPREVVPDGIVAHLEKIVGPQNIVDLQLPYQKVKNLKSDDEMRLLEDAAYISALALRAMLAVIEPGMYETEVAAFGEMIAKYMGCERQGFPIMVGSDTANVTMIGPALNRPIKEGEFVHLGTSYKRDGLTACCRRSIYAGTPEHQILPYQKYLRELVENAFRVGFDSYVDISKENKPAKIQEQALVDYLNSKTESLLEMVQREYGAETSAVLRERLFEDIPDIVKGLARFKPYTGTHNAGYTECQEFYGAITLESDQPLDRQVVTMLDVALRGRGSKWNGKEFEQVIPDFDFYVIEDTLGKYGGEVRNLTGELQPGGIRKGFGKIPVNVQHLIGNIREYKRRS